MGPCDKWVYARSRKRSKHNLCTSTKTICCGTITTVAQKKITSVKNKCRGPCFK